MQVKPVLDLPNIFHNNEEVETKINEFENSVPFFDSSLYKDSLLPKTPINQKKVSKQQKSKEKIKIEIKNVSVNNFFCDKKSVNRISGEDLKKINCEKVLFLIKID